MGRNHEASGRHCALMKVAKFPTLVANPHHDDGHNDRLNRKGSIDTTSMRRGKELADFLSRENQAIERFSS